LIFLDDVHLLQFLRVRKFNIIETFKTFERFYLSPKKYPDIIDFSNENYEKMMKLYESGYCFPLLNRDADGKRIIFARTKLWNPELFSHCDAIRLQLYLCMVLLEEEETQISGISYITDISGATPNQFFSPVFIKNIVSFMSNSFPVRLKNIYIVKLPSFAKIITDFFLSQLKEKLTMRFFTLDEPNEVKTKIDPSLLPIEYGGTNKTGAEMMKAFKVLNEERREKVLQSFTLSIDWNKVSPEKLDSKDEDEGAGSFRKLQID
jgi:alpha-tocopherol transfer protein